MTPLVAAKAALGEAMPGLRDAVGTLSWRAHQIIEAPRSRCVLVVEDDPDDAALLARRLQDIEGVEIQVARSARSADAALLAKLPGVAVIDLNLPGEDGLSFAARVPRTVRVILVSGTVDRELLEAVAPKLEAEIVVCKRNHDRIVELVKDLLDDDEPSSRAGH